MVNGHKIEATNLTSTHIKRIFGHHEYSIVGEFDSSIDTEEIQIIMKAEDASGDFERNISLEPCDNGPIALPGIENPNLPEIIDMGPFTN